MGNPGRQNLRVPSSRQRLQRKSLRPGPQRPGRRCLLTRSLPPLMEWGRGSQGRCLLFGGCQGSSGTSSERAGTRAAYGRQVGETGRSESRGQVVEALLRGEGPNQGMEYSWITELEDALPKRSWLRPSLAVPHQRRVPKPEGGLSGAGQASYQNCGRRWPVGKEN